MDEEVKRQVALALLKQIAMSINRGQISEHLSFNMGIETDNVTVMQIKAYMTQLVNNIKL
jgi:hypothetical protein